MMKSLIWCYAFVSCFVLGLCDVPQCFKLKLGEVSCKEAVGVNTVIKTLPAQNECFSMAKGIELLEKVGKMTGSSEKSEKLEKCEELYNEEKQKNTDLTKKNSDMANKMNTCTVELGELRKKLTVSRKVVQKYYSIPQLRRCGVGLQDRNRVRDNQIYASSQFDANHRAQYGRLFETRGVKAWCVGNGQNNDRQWIKVDLLRDTKVIGVVTAGRPQVAQWVTTYRMQSRTNKQTRYHFIQNGEGSVQIFSGNHDSSTPVVNIFRFPITARWFTIIPVTYSGWMSLQFDLLVC